MFIFSGKDLISNPIMVNCSELTMKHLLSATHILGRLARCYTRMHQKRLIFSSVFFLPDSNAISNGLDQNLLCLDLYQALYLRRIAPHLRQCHIRWRVWPLFGSSSVSRCQFSRWMCYNLHPNSWMNSSCSPISWILW